MTFVLPRVFREDPSLFDGTSLDRRDPSYIRDLAPLAEVLYRYYFRVQARGFERAPRNGPFIMVGNHSGGLAAPDAGMTTHAWCLHRGVDAPAYALIHPTVFKAPYMNVHAMKLGGVAATARMAMKVIERGAPLFIYPGAGDDAYRRFEDRHTISFHGNDAFVRLALRFGVPIVPVISIGAHDTLFVIDDGRERAREWGLAEHGVERVPLTYSLSHGLSLGTHFTVPFPAAIEIEMGEPILLGEQGARKAADQALVGECYNRVERASQAIMDRLLAERRRRDRQSAA
jgi:1-acyl-sn-glycerol-3-phosphate acyltransferase